MAPVPAAADKMADTPADIGPRHAGVLVDAGDGAHAEVLVGDRTLSVWFFDKAMKPLPLPKQAKATLKVDKETKNVSLAKSATEGGLFAGGLDLPKSARVAITIRANVGGKNRKVKLERGEQLFQPPAAVAPTSPSPLGAPPANPSPSPKVPETARP